MTSHTASTRENRLAQETSPYLLQHKHNPVDWWPWGPEALAEAQRTGKPILLSVGYAACHWCHVMAHESFEDADSAAVMNDLFVNIKVDREERPDIDQIYMTALHHLGEQGGWPLTMFLTPAGEPVWGGTYFPKTSRYGRPAFVDVLRELSRLFRDEPARIEQNRNALLARLSARAEAAGQVTIGGAQLDAVAAQIVDAIDPVHGGLKGAPKFPQSALFELLWRAGLRVSRSSSPGRSATTRPGDPSPSQEQMDGRVKPGHDGGDAGGGESAAVQTAPSRMPTNRHFAAIELTLRNICEGGIYDHLGGGFSRYAVDERWLVPHFEKMLYDNAHLLELLALAWQRSGDPLFRRRAQETVQWLAREMTTGEGAFCASLDADSEGEEGKFYVWSRGEIEEVLGADDAAFFASEYDVTPGGNFEGHTILNRLKQLSAWVPASAGTSGATTTVAAHSGTAIAAHSRGSGNPNASPVQSENEQRLAPLRAKLLARRAGRVRPGLDDKVLADWNGLMIAALVRAAIVFDEPSWIAQARRAFDFVTAEMTRGQRLGHSWRDGRMTFPGLASDLAIMIRAALALYEAEGRRADLDRALGWQQALDAHYAHPDGGYFLTADDAEGLVVRPAAINDDAIANHNAFAAENLVRLAALTGDETWRAAADRLFDRLLPRAAASFFAHAGLLNALDARLHLVDIVVTGTGQRADALARTALALPHPTRAVLRVGEAGALPQNHPAQAQLAAAPTGGAAFICANGRCSLPVTDPDRIAETVLTVTG